MSRYFIRVLRDMWLGLMVAAAVPLRLITGRRHPNYRLISALELECGLREPDLIEQFYDPRLTIVVGGRGKRVDPVSASLDRWAEARD